MPREFKHYFRSDGTMMVYAIQDGVKFDKEEPVTPFPNESFDSMRQRGEDRLNATLPRANERTEEASDNCGYTGAD
jgi:hypothetical protein